MVTSCRRIDKQENVTRATPVRSSPLKGSAKALRRNNKTTNRNKHETKLAYTRCRGRDRARRLCHCASARRSRPVPWPEVQSRTLDQDAEPYVLSTVKGSADSRSSETADPRHPPGRAAQNSRG